MEGDQEHPSQPRSPGSQGGYGGWPCRHEVRRDIGQILILDLVFSVDRIITTVSMTPHLPFMIVAVVEAVMLLAATSLANFIERNLIIVMLALAFLLMIGMTLIAEGMGVQVPKGYFLRGHGVLQHPLI